MVHISTKIDPLDAIKQGEHCVEDMGDIEVLIEMVERRRAEVARLRAVLEKILDTALPSSTFRMPPYLVEAIKEALRDAV